MVKDGSSAGSTDGNRTCRAKKKRRYQEDKKRIQQDYISRAFEQLKQWPTTQEYKQVKASARAQGTKVRAQKGSAINSSDGKKVRKENRFVRP